MVAGRRTWLGLAVCAALAFQGAAVVGTADAEAPPSAPAVVVPLSPCQSSDYTKPSLTGTSVTPTSVDVSSGPVVVTVQADIVDGGAPGVPSGIKRVEVGLGSDTPGRGVRLLLHKTAEGEFSGTATIHQGVQGGTWRVTSAFLFDNAGNRRFYDTAELADLGLDAEFEVVSPVLDTQPPTLDAFTFTPSQVNTTITAKTVTFTATASDDVSGIDTFIVGLANDPGRKRVWAELLPVAGSPDTYQGSVLIPRWVGDRPWSVDQVFLEDNLKQRTWLDTGDLADLGFTRTLVVNSGQDFGLPTLAAHSRTPSSVDTRTSNQKVVVRIRLRDAKSGVAGATASFRWLENSGSYGRFQASVRLTRVSGTRHDGVWRGAVVIPRCTRVYVEETYPTGIPAGVSVWQGTVTFRDRAGNQRTVGPTLGASADIRVNSRDNKPPLLFEKVTVPPPPPGTVKLRFSEVVTGINTTSLVYVYGTYDELGPSYPVVLGPPIAGTWTCRNIDKVLVPCQTGRVRFATFVASEPLPDPPLIVVSNPEDSGTLDFRDLAGNAPLHLAR